MSVIISPRREDQIRTFYVQNTIPGQDAFLNLRYENVASVLLEAYNFVQSL